LEQNLPHYHFVYDKSHMDSLGIDPGPPQWEVSDYQSAWLTAQPFVLV
jgi:hypothetical protein